MRQIQLSYWVVLQLPYTINANQIMEDNHQSQVRKWHLDQPSMAQILPTWGRKNTISRVGSSCLQYSLGVNVTEFWKINHFVAHETIRIFMFNSVLP